VTLTFTASSYDLILGFGDLDCLDWALDLACSAEDTTIIGNALVHLLLLSRELHPVEHVHRADSYADAVGDANVKIHSNIGPVDPVLLAYSVLVEDLVLNMSLLCRPLVRKTSVLDELSNVSIRQG